MMPNRIYWQKKLAINNPDCDILSGSAIFVRDNVTVKKAIELDDDEIKKRLRVYNPIIHPTVLFKRERIIDIGGYDSNFERGQDYELWVRAALLGLNFFRDKCIVTRYQYQKKSMRNKWAEVKSLIKIALKYRLPKIPFKNILPLIFN